mmetsp:Transcript_50253/g.114050  ORF Transcript_50253/g.114050 Transcript_50253/m.114050 type:complete len:105 (-) Transcript_50253:237-551(-)
MVLKGSFTCRAYVFLPNALTAMVLDLSMLDLLIQSSSHLRSSHLCHLWPIYRSRSLMVNRRILFLDPLVLAQLRQPWTTLTMKCTGHRRLKIAMLFILPQPKVL